MFRVWIGRATYAAALLFVVALPTSAQITTGVIAGTVKDAQGGVIPGATVTLVSETQNTRSTPAVTTASGDFVFPNLRADTYAIEVAMPSFKTLKRSGVPVSPGQRVALPAARRSRSGVPLRSSTSGPRRRSSRPVPANDRSRSTPPRSQNLPIASRSFTQLASLAPGVTGTSRIGDRSVDRRRRIRTS